MVTINLKKVALIIGLVIVVLGATIAVFLLQLKPAEVPGPSAEEIAAAARLEGQRRLLATPESVGLTPEAYAAEVAKLSVETDTITMGVECSIDPLIIKMKEDSILKIENKDSVEHVLAFEDENFFAVSAGQVREINITQIFGKGEGIYRYRCGDRSQEAIVGIMYVVK